MTSLLFSGYRRVIKSRMTARVIIERVMRFYIEIMFILKAIKSHFKGINRILHSWPFHMTEAKGQFHKFHMT